MSKVLKLIYCTLETPPDQIKKIYRTLHNYNIQKTVEQSPVNNTIITITVQASKKNVSVLKEFGFKLVDEKES